jgi:hypothetical protein
VIIRKVNDGLFWLPEFKVLICLNSGVNLGTYGYSDLRLLSDLVLSCHTSVPRRLCVHRNRSPSLHEHVTVLDQIWQEYEIIDDGWRGAVQVSESDWLLMRLSWC